MKSLLNKLIDMFPSQSKRKKKFYKEMEQTLSKKMQDELEPIPYPCPMHEIMMMKMKKLILRYA